MFDSIVSLVAIAAAKRLHQIAMQTGLRLLVLAFGVLCGSFAILAAYIAIRDILGPAIAALCISGAFGSLALLAWLGLLFQKRSRIHFDTSERRDAADVGERNAAPPTSMSGILPQLNVTLSTLSALVNSTTLLDRIALAVVCGLWAGQKIKK